MNEKIHVLLIDDNEDLNWLNATRLRKLGATAAAVTNADAAMQAAIETKPDLILVDYSLDGITGPELIVSIKTSLKINPHSVVLTGFNADHIREDVRRFGDMQIIQKPLRREDMLDLIDRSLRHRDSNKRVLDGYSERELDI